MKVLICGGRFYREAFAIRDRIEATPMDTVIIHGACHKGADKYADYWAKTLLRTIEKYPADWERHGLKAGPIRNQQMLDEGKPDRVIAFWDGKSPGTRDMITRAKAAGVPVEIVWQTGCEPKQGALPV